MGIPKVVNTLHDTCTQHTTQKSSSEKWEGLALFKVCINRNHPGAGERGRGWIRVGVLLLCMLRCMIIEKCL